MKIFIILILALVAQSYASTYQTSSEEFETKLPRRNFDAERQIDDILQSAAVETSSRWESTASSLPQANSYKAKVTQRINNSSPLEDKPQLKEKLYKLADQKLEDCVKPNAQELDRQCVGRATGQVMQLIRAVENTSRQPTNGSYRRSQINYY